MAPALPGAIVVYACLFLPFTAGHAMAIAVSLLVHASRRLRRWQAGLAASVWIAAVFAWPPDAPGAWLAVLAGLLAHPLLASRNGKGYRIDISDHGRIRLAVYLNPSPCAGVPALPPELPAIWQPATLQAGAVLWPWLLVLPLRLADGKVVRLLILPDSVAPGAFRPLSVACRACAARDL
jgi:toxin CptA